MINEVVLELMGVIVLEGFVSNDSSYGNFLFFVEIYGI